MTDSGLEFEGHLEALAGEVKLWVKPLQFFCDSGEHAQELHDGAA